MENNLLIITRSLPFHNIGGMEAIAWDVARGLAKKGLNVTVLTTQTDALPSLSVIEDVSVHALNVPSGRYSSAWWRKSQSIFAETYADKINVVLSVSAAGMSVARWIKENDKCIKLFVQAHGTAWGEIISKLSTKSLRGKITVLKNIFSLWSDRGYRNFDAFISIGPKVTHILQSWPTKWITGDLRVHEIANGVDVALFSFNAQARAQERITLGLKPEHKVIISTSRLHKQKGVIQGLKGFTLAARQDPLLRYLIIGSGPEEQTLKNYVQDNGIKDKVIFCGAVKRDVMPAHYAAADIFLFPTLRQEGLPLNMMEALACGLPCIISSHIALEGCPLTLIDPQETKKLSNRILEKTKALQNERASLLPNSYWLDHTLILYKDTLLRNNI